MVFESNDLAQKNNKQNKPERRAQEVADKGEKETIANLDTPIGKISQVRISQAESNTGKPTRRKLGS